MTMQSCGVPWWLRPHGGLRTVLVDFPYCELAGPRAVDCQGEARGRLQSDHKSRPHSAGTEGHYRCASGCHEVSGAGSVASTGLSC